MKKKFLTSLLVFFTIIAFAQKEVTKEVEFTTKDKVKISATLKYKTSQLLGTPLIILIHQGGSSRKEWMDLPLTQKLIDQGYAVLAYDIRLHGKSGKDGEFRDLFNNPKRAPLDLEAAINYVMEKEIFINYKRIGILGASIGANLACAATINGYDLNDDDTHAIKSVVVISAKTSAVQNLSGTQEKLTPMNAFYIASKDEQGGKRADWANELYQLTTGKKKVIIADGKKHGSYILREQPQLQNEILNWFLKTL